MFFQTVETQSVAFLTNFVGLDKSLFTDFEFHVGKTALSSLHYPICTVFFYCVGIQLLQYFMKDRAPFSLKWPMVIHNLILSVLSTFLAVVMIAKIINLYQANGLPLFEVYCGLTFTEQKGLLTLLCYWNHLLKYYELVDTIFLALKKKPIGFLHAYHHPATLVLTWTQLVDFSGMQWVVIWLNLCVHMIMYFYYGLAAMHIQVPFKQIVTIFQIAQFVLDLFGCYYGYANIFLLSDSCTGTTRAGIVGCFIITSYLYLFVDFYNETYKTDGKDKKDAKIDFRDNKSHAQKHSS